MKKSDIICLAVIIVCQIIAVSLKLCGVLDKSWLVVFFPTIFPVIVFIVLASILLVLKILYKMFIKEE